MTTHHPAKGVELYVEDDTYVLLFEMPQFDPDEIDVTWHDRRLHVEAEHTAEGDRREVYHRSVGLPREIDESGISASYSEGVLEVDLPISDEQRQTTQIEITDER